MSWAPTKRSLAFWPTRSSTIEVSIVSASVEPERCCSQTSASPPSSTHDQHAPVQRGARGVGDRGQHDRLLDAHVARDVDERAAGPAGVVERREDVLLGVDDRAEVLVHEVGVGLAGERERQDEQIVGGVAAVDHAAVDLPEMVRALGRLEQRLDAVHSARHHPRRARRR